MTRFAGLGKETFDEINHTIRTAPGRGGDHIPGRGHMAGGSSDREKQELERRIDALEKQLERALAENERLRKQLEEALRANKRSAAPFSKGQPKSNPKPPGRKPGAAYGQRATRAVPSRVDEQIHVPLPPRCSHCHGPVTGNHTLPQ